jgi:hypothetical protein
VDNEADVYSIKVTNMAKQYKLLNIVVSTKVKLSLYKEREEFCTLQLYLRVHGPVSTWKYLKIEFCKIRGTAGEREKLWGSSFVKNKIARTFVFCNDIFTL